MPYHENHPIHNEVLRITADKIKEHMYEKIVNLDIVGAVTAEPVPFCDLEKQTFTSFKVGDVWGKVWDCGWFKLSGTLPQSAKGKCVVLKLDFSGEALLVSKDGDALKGFTSVKSNMTYTLGNMGKTVYPLTESAGGGEKFEFIIDAGNNDLFGSFKGGEIIEANFSVCNNEMRELYYDYAVLYEVMMTADASLSLHNILKRALSDVENVLSRYTNEEAKEARKILAPHLARKGAESDFDISVLGHAHLDLAWTWPIRETIRKGARTFATAAHNMEKYPFYKFGASQTQLYAWVKNTYPKLFEKIKKLHKEGRWELQGGMWVESDLNVTGGESLVRQILYGQRFFKKHFGKIAKIAWLPDTFGFTGALPQLLKSGGMTKFVTQKIRTSPHRIDYPHDTFFWEGIDGSKVLTAIAPFENYGSSASPKEINCCEKRFRDKMDCPSALLLFGQGDGGGGAGFECLESLARTENIAGLSKTVSRTGEEFFSKIEKNSDKYQTWYGSMDLDMHTGTLTSAAESKKANKQMEIAFHTLEWLSTLTDIDISKAEIDEMYEFFLLYQFHDILPGSSINRVYDESLPHYAAMLERLNISIKNAMVSIAQSIDCTGDEVVLFNPSPVSRKETVMIKNAVMMVEMKPYQIMKQKLKNEKFELFADDNIIENKNLKVKISKEGYIVSIFDKKLQREFVKGYANKLLVYQDILNYNEAWGVESAWDFPIRYKDKMPEAPVPVKFASSCDSEKSCITVDFTFNESKIKVCYTLKADGNSIDIDFETDWQESKKMLRSLTSPKIFSKTATRGIQFGHLKQNMHKNTVWDYSLFETVASRFVDKSQGDCGLSLLSPFKYGVRVQDGELDLNLLRSSNYPATAVDKGFHKFNFSIFPHSGDVKQGKVLPAALNLEYPVMWSEGSKNKAKTMNFVTQEKENVIIETIKRAEDEDAVIYRIYEPNGEGAKETLTFSNAISCSLVNILEEKISDIEIVGNCVCLDFLPFQIKTIMVKSKKQNN